MRTIQDYLEAAREHQHLGSDRQLAKKLGLAGGAVHHFRTGKALPSPDTMVKLARLAGLDEQVALVELAFMSTEGEAKGTYEKILKRISTFLPATLFGLLCMSSKAAFASTGNEIASLPHLADSVSSFAIIMYIMGILYLSKFT